MMNIASIRRLAAVNKRGFVFSSSQQQIYRMSSSAQQIKPADRVSHFSRDGNLDWYLWLSCQLISIE